MLNPAGLRLRGPVLSASAHYVLAYRICRGYEGDANNDAIVNGQDIALVATNWLSVGAGESAAVPEPGALGMAIVGMLFLVHTGARMPLGGNGR